MRANITKIKKCKRYSEEFKKTLVSLFEHGEYSILQLEKLYKVSNVMLYKWVYKYSVFNEKGYRIVEMKESNQDRLKGLTSQVSSLEQSVGQKQIQIEYLEKLIELATLELGVDIKKNYSLLLSNGSKKIVKK